MLADKTLFRESLRELTVIFVDSQDATVGRESGFSAGPLLDLLAAVFTCVAFGLELFASMTTSHSPRKDVAITNGVGIGRSLRLPTDAESTTTTGRSQKDRENGREEKKNSKNSTRYYSSFRRAGNRPAGTPTLSLTKRSTFGSRLLRKDFVIIYLLAGCFFSLGF